MKNLSAHFLYVTIFIIKYCIIICSILIQYDNYCCYFIRGKLQINMKEIKTKFIIDKKYIDSSTY